MSHVSLSFQLLSLSDHIVSSQSSLLDRRPMFVLVSPSFYNLPIISVLKYCFIFNLNSEFFLMHLGFNCMDMLLYPTCVTNIIFYKFYIVFFISRHLYCYQICFDCHGKN